MKGTNSRIYVGTGSGWYCDSEEWRPRRRCARGGGGGRVGDTQKDIHAKRITRPLIPIGIIIGIFIAEAPEDSELAQGYMNCIAAGTLVYVSCNEMIAELFSHETKVPFCRLIGLVGGLILGIAVMAVLAIWA